MDVGAHIFRDISRLAASETDWLKRHAIGRLSATDPAVGKLGRTDKAALGAFCGSLDLAAVACRVVRESARPRRRAAAGITLVRPALEWYLRGMWLRNDKDTDSTSLFVSFGDEENTRPEPRKSLADLLDFTEELTRKAADRSYAAHIPRHFDEMRDLRQPWNNQIHGGPKAMLESVTEVSVASRYNFGMLTDTAMIIGRTAFWASIEIMRAARPDRDRGIVLKRLVEFERGARKLGHEESP